MKVKLIALSSVVASSLMASDSTVTLQEVMVSSASGFEQKITDAPASISVITAEQLQKKQYANIAQVLEDVEGVDVRDGGNGKTGGLNVSIRGMGSANTLILIDGRRQNGSGDITPNGFGETAGNFLPPLSAIERIEVIRGPMSTLYGSDAMGGVINIITKKVSSEWSGSLGYNRTFNQHRDFGDSGVLNAYVSGPIVDGVLGVSLRGSFYERNESNIVYGDGEAVSTRGSSPVEGKNYSLGAKFDLIINEQNDLWLDLSTSRQSYDNSKGQLGTLNTATVSSGYDTRLRFERDAIAFGHKGNYEFGVLESSLSRTETRTKGRLIPGTIGAVTVTGAIGGDGRKLENIDTVFDTKFTTELNESNILVVGAQYIHGETTDGIANEKFKKDMWSLFAEDEYKILDNLALTLGARYDNDRIFGGHFSPRAYLVWDVDSNWTLKGGVSTGYKAPTANQIHDGINGATRQGRQLTIGSPHLGPEKSINYEMGAYFHADNGFSANATVFHNQYKDKIDSTTVYISGRQGIPDGDYSQSYNVDRADITGLELGTKIPIISSVWVNANYTYMKSKKKSGVDEGLPLNTTPKHMANATLNYQTTPKLLTWLKGEYRSKRARYTSSYAVGSEEEAIMNQVGDVKAYALFSLGANYQVTKYLNVTASIYNLFDHDFLKRSEYVYNGVTKYAVSETNLEGRRLWLGFNVTF